MLAERATCDPGRLMCRQLEPMSDQEDIDRAQDQTEAAAGILLRGTNLSFGSVHDFNGYFAALAVEHALSAPQLLQIASFLENVARVKLAAPEDGNNALFDLFDALVPLSPISSQIRRCILADDLVADDASPALRSIRREQHLTQERIHSQLAKMVNGSLSSYLQDNVITVRDDRYCIPVKAEYKSNVKGIVHDASSTGSTLFIEPAQIVELGNTARELEAQEKKEIEKILADLSSSLTEHLLALRDDLADMTQLDFIFAKAQLALDMNATRPVFNRDHIIRLHKARHPLIDPKKVVPIDLELGDKAQQTEMIVITGPNTGGKTVTLKTVGLLEIMGMAGLQIPASDHSELSVFREVFADIGDEQSIEQSLSTFSAHMTSVIDIMKHADKNCLCLFDELGAGTDPAEGAALAIAILDFFHTRHIVTLATTHYSELKVYAMQTPGVVNASCEFDVETLRPTYRLIIGMPGKSNAFLISQKLGMPGYIIQTAREQLSTETKNFDDLLSELEEGRKANEKMQQELNAQKAELEQQQKKLREKEQAFEEKRRRLLQNANEEARNILQNAKESADRAISQVRKSSEKADIDSMEQTRARLRRKVSARDKTISDVTPRPARSHTKASDLHLGDRVKILSMNMEGFVSSLPDKQERLHVRCGIIDTKTVVSDVVLIQEEPDGTVAQHGRGRGSSGSRAGAARSMGGSRPGAVDLSRGMDISPEINLIGLTTDEAIYRLDKYLDDARMAHLDSVRIVHGKGTGALRSAVQNYLRRQSFVKSYRNGEFGEGDAGVTIAEL